MALAAVCAVAMCVLAFIFRPELPFSGLSGICLPPPSEWGLPPVASWIINVLLLGATAAAIWRLNHKFNFNRTTRPVLPALFLVFVASDPWITVELSSSLIMCAANVVALWLLFSVYDSPDATQPMFVTGTFISIGSMFEYAFVPMVAVYLIAAIVLKIFRVKEIMAFILGLVAPYWVCLGFGWISPLQFQIPSPSPLFSDPSQAADLFLLVLSAGIAVLFGLAFGIADAIKIYAGNSRVNAMNSVIVWMGIICAVCMTIDFNNLPAYLATLFFCVALQFANLCALWQIRHEWLVSLIPSAVYVALFVLMVFI